MKPVFKLNFLMASLSLSTETLAYAAPTTPTTSDSADLSQQIQQVSAQTQKLQKEVQNLRAQLRQKKSKPAVASAATVGSSGKTFLNRFNHPVTVTTSPLIGDKVAYNASDILQEVSKMNEDLSLLKERGQLFKELDKENLPLNRPVIEISGALEGQLYAVHGFGAGNSPDGIELDTAEIDFQGIVSPWAAGFAGFKYNAAPASTGSRDPQSTLYLDRGFVTIGNLNSFPMYGSIGEMYVPFGRYSSLMLTTPMTQSLARTRSATALAGFSQSGAYGSVYSYDGDQTSGGSTVFKQGGFDVGYTMTANNASGNMWDVGTGVASNIADSQGLQNTGGGTFAGFAQTTNGNAIAHRVPALDLHTKASYGNWFFTAEYIAPLEAFSASDFAFANGSSNLSGAKPQAVHAEVNYTMNVSDNKPLTFGAAFDNTWQALAANLPKTSYTADMAISWWRDTVEQIEYRHDDDYTRNDTATGSGGSSFHGTGQTRNSYTAQVGVYF